MSILFCPQECRLSISEVGREMESDAGNQTFTTISCFHFRFLGALTRAFELNFSKKIIACTFAIILQTFRSKLMPLSVQNFRGSRLVVLH